MYQTIIISVHIEAISMPNTLATKNDKAAVNSNTVATGNSRLSLFGSKNAYTLRESKNWRIKIGCSSGPRHGGGGGASAEGAKQTA